jgi:hypothetical protein
MQATISHGRSSTAFHSQMAHRSVITVFADDDITLTYLPGEAGAISELG